MTCSGLVLGHSLDGTYQVPTYSETINAVDFLSPGLLMFSWSRSPDLNEQRHHFVFIHRVDVFLQGVAGC